MLSGTVSAGETGNNRPVESYAWGNDEIWEMLESEPGLNHGQGNGKSDVTPLQDNEGNHMAHRPLWVIAATGLEHSPHPAPVPGIDHVVPIGGGGEFTAQWHVHLVLDKPGGDLTNVAKEGGELLTSADAIRSASASGDIFIVPLFDPVTGEPNVFTCPIRPHMHK